MTHAAITTPGQDLSDRAVSLIRTRVPILWGSLIAALITWVSPHLPVDLVTWAGAWLGSETTVALVGAAAIYAWYWAWRRLEPRIPVWLIRLVLGSAQAPIYGVNVVELTDAEVADAAALRDALDEGDPTRAVLDKVLLARI